MARSTQTNTQNWLQANVLGASRVHFFFVLAYGLFTIAYDGWHLTPPPVVAQRWELSAGFLVGITAIWFLAHQNKRSDVWYASLLTFLITLDLVIAGFSIYGERGMTSRGVMLFAIPITVAALSYSRVAIFAVASLSTATYVFAAIKYFYDHPYEGYKVELYGIVGFYCVMFFILAGLLTVLTRRFRQ
jgi:hypothetical protein